MSHNLTFVRENKDQNMLSTYRISLVFSNNSNKKVLNKNFQGIFVYIYIQDI